MRKITFLMLVCLAYSVLALAQTTPAVELFGGYSLQHTGSFNLNGWNGAATANINRWLGISADFDGHYSHQSSPQGQIRLNSDIYSFMFGPQVSYRTTRFSLFSHALFGVSLQTTTDIFALQTPALSVSNSANQFQFALGGGLDLRLTRAIAVRPVQADYVLTNYPTRNVNQLRYSTGIVVRLGGGALSR